MEPCKPEGDSYFDWFMQLKDAGYIDEVPIPNSAGFTFDVNWAAPEWVWQEFPKVHGSLRAALRASKANRQDRPTHGKYVSVPEEFLSDMMRSSSLSRVQIDQIFDRYKDEFRLEGEIPDNE